MQEFFLNIKDLLRQSQNDADPSKQFQLWNTAANDLQLKFNNAKNAVHLALCDNIDTRTVLDTLRDLVGLSNIYIRDHNASGSLNLLLLKRIALYITEILHIFGVINGPRGGIGFPLDSNANGNLEETVMPYLTALSEFRHSVREVARAQKSLDVLNLCDALRDDILPNLGVRLEDREGAAASIKLVDRETLLRERDAKKQAEAQKQALKEKKKQEVAAAVAAAEAQSKINPKEMFLNESEYSEFDERVSKNQILGPDTDPTILICCYF